MLRTFRIGGVHLEENKLSKDQRLKALPMPKEVIIPLGQHIGSMATPIVKKGDLVKVGTLIATSSGFVSANIHSSVSGKVFKLDEAFDASGYKKPVVVIRTDGLDEWEETIDRSTDLVQECKLSPQEILTKISEAGIVGLGGATFPSQVKLTPPKEQKAEVLIINAVECEPYLTSDHILMLEHPDEILVGANIVMKSIGVERCIIGIENNKLDAIQLLKEKAKAYKGIEVQTLKVQYPQGGEKQLIDALLNKQIKSGALPISVGAIVHNVGTIFAIYEAVQKHKPLVDRVVTMTGKELKKPCNLLVRIGTPIEALVEEAGGLPKDTGKIIGGGPMMGKALLNLQVPITKGTSGILLLPSLESQRKKMRSCIRCAKCVNVCPMGLNPTFLMRDIQYKAWEDAEAGYVVDCIECGACNYICPSNRPLLDYIRIGKLEVTKQIKARKTAS